MVVYIHQKPWRTQIRKWEVPIHAYIHTYIKRLSWGPHTATSKKTHHNVKEIRDTTRTIIQFPVLLQSYIFKKKLASTSTFILQIWNPDHTTKEWASQTQCHNHHHRQIIIWHHCLLHRKPTNQLMWKLWHKMEAAEIKYFTPTDQRGKRKHGSFSLHTILLTSFVHDADGTQMRNRQEN